MVFSYPECDFKLDSKKHPNHNDMVKDVSNFLKSFDLNEASENTNWLDLTAFNSRCFADYPYSERLLIANRLQILWFIIDDLRDDQPPREENKYFHKEHIDLCRDITQVVTHPVLRALQNIFEYIKQNSNPVWYQVFQDTAFQSACWSHEMFYEQVLTKPDYSTALICRIWDGYLYPYYMMEEFITERYLPPYIRGNPCYYTMLYYTVLISMLYNDFVSTEKDLVAQNPYWTVSALQREKNLSVQDTIYEGRGVVMKYFREFMAVKTRVDKLFVGPDLKLMQMVSNFFHRLIQGNKDYSTDVSHRYFGNQSESNKWNSVELD